MADAGEIKAKITIEYDGSGVEQAKEDLSSLSALGGSFEQTAQDIGGVLSDFSNQFAGGTSVVEEFGGTVEALGKPLGAGQLAISQLASSLQGGTDGVAAMQGAFEDLQAPLGTTVTMLQAAPEPIAQISKNAESLQKPLTSVNDSFAAISDSLTQSIPLLPQFADSLHSVSETFTPAVENMSVFQDALVNPYPFSMIQQHLDETGQTWTDFTSSIGDENASYLKEMASNADVTHEVLGGMQKDFTGTANVADTLDWNAIGPPPDWTKRVGAAAENVSALGNAVEDTAQVLPQYGWSRSPVQGSVPFGPWPEGQQFAFTEPGAGGLDLGAMMGPMMAVSMIMMAGQAIGQAISQFMINTYQMASLMEGPAAHSVGTFTGTVDGLGQTLQKSSMQFSEGFGQQIIPLLSVANNLASGNNGMQLGGTLGNLANAALVAMLPDPLNQMLIQAEAQAQAPSPLSPAQRYTMTQLSQMPQTIDMSAAQMNIQADQALAESMSPDYLAAVRKMSESQQILQQSQLQYNATHRAMSRQQLLAQYQFEQYAAGQGFTPDQIAGMEAGNYGVDQVGAGGGGSFDVSDIFGAFQGGAAYGPSTGISSFIANAYRGIFSGIGNVANFVGQNWQDLAFGIFGPAGAGADATPGCFPAGIRVLMADGTERAIEMLYIGEHVLAHDGEKHVVTTVLSLIRPPRKMVYELVFSDGNTLTLTDAHPIMTEQGWKSLSPGATKRENPDLVVSRLQTGDNVLTAHGVCALTNWHPGERVQVYNITVDAPHTFYANGVLVHNKVMGATADTGLGAQIADMISTIKLPHIDLSGITSGLASAFGGIQLPHLDLSGFTSGLGSLFSGIQLPHIDLSGFTSGLANIFSGIQLPHIDLSGLTSGLASAFSSIQMPHIDFSSIMDFGSSLSSTLGNMFSSIHLPSIPDIAGNINGVLGNMFGGLHLPSIPDLAGDINSTLGNMFGSLHLPSIPDIAGDVNTALGNMFGGIHLPSLPDIAGSINSLLSGIFSGIHIPSIPGFASGVQDFGGGLAWVAEEGQAELVTSKRLMNLPPGSSVTPLSQIPGPNFSGGIGGGSSDLATALATAIAAALANVNIHNYMYMDTQMVASATVPYIAPILRGTGRRQ